MIGSFASKSVVSVTFTMQKKGFGNLSAGLIRVRKTLAYFFEEMQGLETFLSF